MKRKYHRLWEEGKPCSEEDLADLLGSDETYLKAIGKKALKKPRKRGKAKAPLPEEEQAIRRLQQAVNRLEDEEAQRMDFDE